VAAVVAGALTVAAPVHAAAPTPAWTVRGFALPTQFSPTEGPNNYSFAVINNGSATSSLDAVTLTDHLPGGLTMTFPESGEGVEGSFWSCSETTAHVVTCTLAEEIPPGGDAPWLEIGVSSPAESAAPLENNVTVSGGGAPRSASTTQSTKVSSAPQQFGVTEFSMEARDAEGKPELKAGGHPWQVTASFGIPFQFKGQPESFYRPMDNLKALSVELPLGLVGNPLATPERCNQERLVQQACPSSSKVGSIAIGAGIFENGHFQSSSFHAPTALFNMVPEPGYAAQFAFAFLNQPIYLDATVVHSAAGERLRLSTVSVPPLLESGDLVVSLWGEPGQINGSGSEEALITNPTDCADAATPARLELISWGDPGHPVSAEASLYPHLEGCEELNFVPSLGLAPEAGAADSPSGLSVDLGIPQTSLFEERATPQLRDATVTLPEGLVADPALADGLGACRASGPEGINLGSIETGPWGQDLGDRLATELGAGWLHGNGSIYADSIYHAAPGHCPPASTLGTATVEAPILPEPLTGHVYLGTPDCAPCSGKDAQEGRLIKLYIEAAGNGIIVKLPGTASADPQTGRLTASFKENPQLPFEHLKLNFFGGARAPLSTPATCGTFTTTSDVKPWSAPATPDATPTSSFKIASGPGGGTCANTPAEEPNAPIFSAGSTSPAAGVYSPFVLKLSRADGSQRLHSIDTTLPAGLTAKLAGVAECSDAQIAAAAGRAGAAEKASPSCPLSSELGIVNVGAGAGPKPFHVSGHAYLAGPYKGAPLSLAIVTPAVAGPFDLGTVVVRVALHVDPETAQIHAVSDEIPQILAGIPLDVRSIALNVTRNQFTLNPTSCNPSAVAASALADSSTATLSSPFQVGGCGALAFKPKLAISLRGGTRRTKHPALKAVVTYPSQGAYANIERAQVTLPHSEFLDQAHIGTVCTRVQFAAGNGNGEQCPAASIYGHARAITPLLDRPLEGPVYLRSSSHKLPDLVAALDGQIDVALVGKIDTGKGGGIRNTFELVPDAPVTKFVLSMKGGTKGLLVNSENICAKPQKALAHFVAQNGKVSDTEPLIANSCKKKSHRGAHK
jgi:hypothetical protein